MKVGYARAATAGEDSAAQQLDALKKAGCRRVFSEEDARARSRLPSLECCLKSLRQGDTLVVWKIDRLGRSVREVVALLQQIRDRGVAVHSISEAIDTAGPAGSAVWSLIEALAGVEHSTASERVSAGLQAAKDRGVRLGRHPRLSTEQITRARHLIEQGEPPARVATLLGVHRATLYRALAR